jgi:hypothetical protein
VAKHPETSTLQHGMEQKRGREREHGRASAGRNGSSRERLRRTAEQRRE